MSSSDEENGIRDQSSKSAAQLHRWKSERKVQKRKWHEEKLIKKLEKERQIQISSTPAMPTSLTASRGRQYTVSIAVPGSILDNAQSPELRTYLVGQIARAAVIFNVDEIVVFDETGTNRRSAGSEMVGKRSPACIQMSQILEYLECPQYLRKSFYPKHTNLKYAGLLNPLATPHHMSQDVECEYREGVVLDKPVKEGKGSYVNVGIADEIQIDKRLQAGCRVTVRMKPATHGRKRVCSAVGLDVPRTHAGLYWGYTVRLAACLSRIFTESPYIGGYDMMIGTSERGRSVDEFHIKQFKHLLIVFGGLHGLESSLAADEDLEVDDPELLFHYYLNTCPQQGSSTIRTEEAILITLSILRPKILMAHQT